MFTCRNLSLSLVLTLIVLMGVSQAFGMFNCCRKYTQRKLHLKTIENFYVQESRAVCDIDAIVFTVNKGPCGNQVEVCADPNQKRVRDLMTAIKKRTKQSKSRKLKKQRKQCKPQRKSNKKV